MVYFAYRAPLIVISVSSAATNLPTNGPEVFRSYLTPLYHINSVDGWGFCLALKSSLFLISSSLFMTSFPVFAASISFYFALFRRFPLFRGFLFCRLSLPFCPSLSLSPLTLSLSPFSVSCFLLASLFASPSPSLSASLSFLFAASLSLASSFSFAASLALAASIIALALVNSCVCFVSSFSCSSLSLISRAINSLSIASLCIAAAAVSFSIAAFLSNNSLLGSGSSFTSFMC